MSGFTESSLARKLNELNNSAPSIQQLSLWIVHHKKHYQKTVKTWYTELVSSAKDRKLSFLYLANDVVQNVRKNKPEFVVEFGSRLAEVFTHLASVSFDDKTVGSIQRLILIWDERQIFDKKLIAKISDVWKNRNPGGGGGDAESPRSHTPPLPAPPPAAAAVKRRSPSPPADSPPPKKRNASQSHSETEDMLAKLAGVEDPAWGNGEVVDPPDPVELCQAITGLDDTATGDAVVREEISKLPAEVSDPSPCSDLAREDAESLMEKVQDATRLLEDYNERLENELRERRRVSRLIYDFVSSQKTLVTDIEERIDEYRDKLDKVRNLEEDIRNHLSSLPDIPPPNTS